MSAGRVLATQQARDAAKQMLALTGPVKEQVKRVLQHGGVLADPNQWNCSLAGQWRSDWGRDANQLNQAAAKLERRARQVIEDIFKADSSPPSGAPEAPGSIPPGMTESDDGSASSFTTASATGDRADNLSMLGPPDKGTSEDNADWWASLSEEERRALIARDPGALGNLDGLPAAVRDEALPTPHRLDRAHSWWLTGRYCGSS